MESSAKPCNQPRTWAAERGAQQLRSFRIRVVVQHVRISAPVIENYLGSRVGYLKLRTRSIMPFLSLMHQTGIYVAESGDITSVGNLAGAWLDETVAGWQIVGS